MNNGKGRIETWQQRKKVVRKRRAARRSNCSSSHKDRGRASVPFVFLSLRSTPPVIQPLVMILLLLTHAARRPLGLAANSPLEIFCRCAPHRCCALLIATILPRLLQRGAARLRRHPLCNCHSETKRGICSAGVGIVWMQPVRQLEPIPHLRFEVTRIEMNGSIPETS